MTFPYSSNHQQLNITFLNAILNAICDPTPQLLSSTITFSAICPLSTTMATIIKFYLPRKTTTARLTQYWPTNDRNYFTSVAGFQNATKIQNKCSQISKSEKKNLQKKCANNELWVALISTLSLHFQPMMICCTFLSHNKLPARLFVSIKWFGSHKHNNALQIVKTEQLNIIYQS